MPTDLATLRKYPSSMCMNLGHRFELSKHDPDEDKRRRFSIVALTGQVIKRSRFSDPVVIDMKGLKIKSNPTPVLRDHDFSMVLGHSENIQKKGGELSVEGVFSGPDRVTAEVLEMFNNEFPFQASIGFGVDRIQFLDDSEEATVNGRNEKGPLMILRETELHEISFVPLGADDATQVKVLSWQPDGQKTEEKPMPDTTQVDLDAAKKAGAEEASKRFAELKAEFPERIEFAAEQFAKGNGVQEAKAELADLLLEEAKTRDEIVVARDKEIAELKATQNSGAGKNGDAGESAGTDASGFSGASDGDPQDFTKLARAKAKEDKITLAAAMSQICRKDPEIWDKHVASVPQIPNLPLEKR